ncbi:MAG: hypothetical protein ACREJM_05695 [Candidatus Saccharimonadales bacterium]
MSTGQAFVFINVKQAARFGHVGWGFALGYGQDQYFFGATDHLIRHRWWNLGGWLAYSRVAPGAEVDWWGETGNRDQMMQSMSPPQASRQRYHIWYHYAKAIDVSQAQPEKALALAQALETGGWSVTDNNCVQQSYRVLSAYGAELPPVSSNPLSWLPKPWFARIHGEIIRLPV